MSLPLENYSSLARQAVTDAAEAFHLKAFGADGNLLSMPACFQRNDDKYPAAFRSGKASPDELQSKLAILATEPCIPRDNEDLRQLILANGLGIDCSNLTYFSLKKIHEKLGLGDYAETVFRDSQEVAGLSDTKPGWQLEPEQRDVLVDNPLVSVAWLAKALGKEPQFLAGCPHIAAPEAVLDVTAAEVTPGDLAAFRPIGSTAVVHLAVVVDVDKTASLTEISFWHCLSQTEVLASGIRKDTVVIRPDSTYSYSWSPDATERLEHTFGRPRALVAAGPTFSSA